MRRLSRNLPPTSGIIKGSRAMTNSPTALAGVTLHSTEAFSARRMGRYILVELLAPHRVLSTSAHCGGQREDIRFLANHQSCEAQGDTERQVRIASLGLVEYHREVCREIAVDPDHTALMGTAANMAYACHRWAEFEGLRADALVTAGVSGNAARAGDPAQWNETDRGWRNVSPYAGTINTILVLSCPLTEAAQARAVITMTEAKSAALAELAVPSLYSPTIATGTGTDQFCLAVPLDSRRMSMTSTSPHVKLGEIIGVSVKNAVRDALRWQNGLEPSYTRSLFHALGRFGLTEARALEALAQLLPQQQFDLLQKNLKSVFYEPGVAAAAYAFAAVLDRVAFGTVASGMATTTLRQQAACLASALAAKPQDWQVFYGGLTLPPDVDHVELVLKAIALGWGAKWT
ncbi:MAG: adenosylcobinamide amidohydrolase [Bryobacterales bacterium]|nr:adenosylcobinamide amidohydrolase [Bryobacterales bacterium]